MNTEAVDAGATGVAPFWAEDPKCSAIDLDPDWTVLRPLLVFGYFQGCWSWPVYSPSGEALGVLVLFRTDARPAACDETDLLDCACRILSLLVEQRLLVEDLRFQAEHDATTGAVNSVTFEKLLARVLNDATNSRQPVTIICLDVDRMRSVNELLGRSVGDELLRLLSARVSESLRPQDTLARTGGNEFIALLPGNLGPGGALREASTIAALLEDPFALNDSEIHLRASIGVATFPDHACDAKSLLQAVQATLRRIKTTGRNRIEVCDARIDHADVDRARLESALRHALYRGELLLFYQPKVRLSDGELDGAEALMRWRSAELGLISPALFIPIAEETGEIIGLGRWALEEALRQAHAWDGIAGRPQRIAVNVSAVQLARAEFASDLALLLANSGVDPSKLELEVTESCVLGDLAATQRRLTELRNLGIHLAMDDFGTGYSSLSVLRELPFDTVKVDKAFLNGLDGDTLEASSALNVLRRLIGLGHDLGKKIIVEGVETRAQLKLLNELGCDIVQGYIFGRPAPASEWDAQK
jgi:diguanylate cyclase (GGDEF)-like protein